MKIKKNILIFSLTTLSYSAFAQSKPNIVVLFADDISAREFPLYGSSTWSKPEGGDTKDEKFRAKTPVINQLAKEGCWIKTCWAATVSSPSRAQMMTGRFAYIQKWWHNGDCGKYKNSEGKQETWPLYESSPLMMGKLAQMGGYASYWAGKTQMPHSELIDKYGFDEGCYTPGNLNEKPENTDFYMNKVSNGKYKIMDSGREVETYQQTSYYWKPSVLLINNPNCSNSIEMWPNNKESKATFGLNSYGPDIEQDFIFDFMKRKHKEGKPFFIYHTTHLGHDSYNFINPDSKTHWVATPKVTWKNGKYYKQTPNITGSNGVYDTHNSLSDEGIHSQVTYLDYVVWRYIQEFKKLGVDKNTVFIICADNGTSRYGKASVVCQKGVHVPMIIYAPGLKMTKKGEQNVLMNLADVLPTVADLAKVKIPADYEIDGESILPFLTTSKKIHRDWVYGYRSAMQLIRGNNVLRDGNGIWYDVTASPADLISFPVIKDWDNATKEQKAEKDKLDKILPRFDLYKTAYNGPGGTFVPTGGKNKGRNKEVKKLNMKKIRKINN